MKKITFLLMLCMAGVANGANAQPGSVFDLIENQQKEIDPEGELRKPVDGVLRAGCDINAVIGTSLNGNRAEAQKFLRVAQQNLRAAATALAKAATNARYKRAIKLPASMAAQFEKERLKMATIADVLGRMAELAKQSSDMIEALENGKGTIEDFRRLVNNSTELTRLIAAVYDLLPA